MKDYSKNTEEGKKFITKYEIKDGNIVVHFATANDWIIPHTEENENSVLKIMEEQVNQVNNISYKVDNSIIRNAIMVSVAAALIVVCIFLIANGSASTLTYISGGCFILTFVMDSLSVLSELSKKREIKKINLFLREKQDLNGQLSKSKNKNITNGISEKAQKTIVTAPTNSTRVIDINNLDNFSLSDLQSLIKNIEKSRQFNFFYGNQVSDVEEKGQAKVLKLNNK